ncbi:accessory Sec system protein Asp2 [Staphylococcus lutrae]|uniref:Accessory Sec system protein Asp2 n=1 Tax=Staphylococcus lutrae TaxID=155085 RepID=A0AAC9RU45_9STAP|nr:accessory Sec system protein Asp2 [Staphylococcus lutrae]ARJ50755.1 accessory Sec system protein Asp2 [Staphylococcus lutrae]PNZ37854.1 accessory Sec system protein Asp2 [Staphylococcus lutrae]
MSKFRLLQIGGQSLEPHYTDRNRCEFEYLDLLSVSCDEAFFASFQKKATYDIVFVQSAYSAELMALLKCVSVPYNTLIDYHQWGSAFQQETIVRERLIRPFYYESPEACVEKILALSFSEQYGDRISPANALVDRHFNGSIIYEGNDALVLTGHFGDTFQPIITWKMYLFYDGGKVNEIWPEYTCTGDVDIRFTFRLVDTEDMNHISRTFVLDRTNLDQPLSIPSQGKDAFVLISAEAKGTGTLRMGAFHKRWSRMDLGAFILGGERYVDPYREEFIHYFDPRDFKPPLAVYFSGYRTAEGFEGYYMMREFKCPFLLIADLRLEGGAFYMGSSHFEAQIVKVIKEKLDFLGFKEDELIISGLSMGSFGALYYGAQIEPGAIIVGKPLVNIGNIATDMRLRRPEEFGTALDILMKNEKAVDHAAAQRLNQKFWHTFQQAHLKETTVAVSYMEDDDYDLNAFDMLLPVLTKKHVHVMSRSIPGRHNDDTLTINSWFINFYKMILEKRYGRVMHERKT